MGRASRWLKALFGMRKDKDLSNSGDRKNRTPSCIGRSRRSSPAEAHWVKSVDSQSDQEDQNKHANAVAAATAAAADAAIAAAQAAVAVVKLTSQGPTTVYGGASVREHWAAVKIQSMFRGCLARRALKALKGLVKVQALIRGFLVRKQAAATLRKMEAMMRAQSKSKSNYNLLYASNKLQDDRFPRRRSSERFNERKSECIRSIHSKRLSSSFESLLAPSEKTPQIVEMNHEMANSRLTRANTWTLDDANLHIQNFSFSRFRAHSSRNHHDPDLSQISEASLLSMAQDTPRFTNSGGSTSIGPSRNGPNYMTNTESFEAKFRAQSAPKQRPEFELGPKKRVSNNEIMEPRISTSSGVKMQRSSSQGEEVRSFKNIVMGRFDRP